MSKLDEMKKATTLGSRPGAFPPGIDPTQATGRPKRLEGVRGDRSAALIAVDRIQRDPDQPRTEFDQGELDRLAESLRTRGQLQPIRVRWDEEGGKYMILAGERRWKAAQLAGLTEIQCTVQEAELSDTDRLAVQLVENALRDDLKPMEQARAYRRLMDAKGWTMTELAGELAIHQTSVARALSMLQLPEVVRDRVEQGGLAPSAAAEIAKLDNPADQIAIAEAVEDEKLGRDDVAAIVRAVKARKAPPKKPDPISFEVGDGCTVQVRWKKSGPSVVQALKKALKLAQELKQSDDHAAGNSMAT